MIGRREIGRQFQALYGSPLLKKGQTFATLNMSDTMPVAKNSFMMRVSVGARDAEQCFRKYGGTPSKPLALAAFRDFSIFSSSCYITGVKSISADDIGGPKHGFSTGGRWRSVTTS